MRNKLFQDLHGKNKQVFFPSYNPGFSTPSNPQTKNMLNGHNTVYVNFLGSEESTTPVEKNNFQELFE